MSGEKFVERISLLAQAFVTFSVKQGGARLDKRNAQAVCYGRQAKHHNGNK